MIADDHMPQNSNTDATADEAALAQVLESYLAQLEAGVPAIPPG
jgi:hypothetical protein